MFVKRYPMHPRDFFKFKDSMMLHMGKIKREYDCSFANMAYSDYRLPWSVEGGYKPPYWDEAENFIDGALKNYANTWKCSEINIQSMWFAEYKKGNNFNWHTHEGCNLSAVLQVHGGPNTATQLYGLDEIKITAGDLIIFPAMLPHRGPRISGHKICLGFNLSMGGSLLHNE